MIHFIRHIHYMSSDITQNVPTEKPMKTNVSIRGFGNDTLTRR